MLAFLQLRQKYTHLPTTNPVSLEDIKEGIKSSYLELKQACQHAKVLRDLYLAKRAQLYATLEEVGNRKAVERLKQAKALSKTYRKLLLLKKTNASAGITELQVPLDTTINPRECNPNADHWRTKQVPAEIEQLLLSQNGKHFGQADGTPFTTGTLNTALGYHGYGPVAELILEGNYSTKLVDGASQLLLQHLRKCTDTMLTGVISSKEIVDKLKTWNKKT